MKRIAATVFLLILLLAIAGTGCRREDVQEKDSLLQRVVLQTDWFAQPEHGGFYQALAKGYYAEAGLEVSILQGGPNSMSTQKILKGSAQFAMHRADAICLMAHRGVDVRLVMATLQHDPQGIMLHEANPVRSFEDLDGARVMAVPGLSWIQWIEKKYGIKMDIIPHDFGLQRFLNDENFIQQCLITNEPFYARLAGASPRVMRLSDSGFDPCHGVYCLSDLVTGQPDLVRRFVSASIRGWQDFILNDPTPAMDLIRQRNPRMTDEFMQFCYDAMVAEGLVTGHDPSGQMVGLLEEERLRILERDLVETGVLEQESRTGTPWFSTEFISPLDVPARGHP